MMAREQQTPPMVNIPAAGKVRLPVSDRASGIESVTGGSLRGVPKTRKRSVIIYRLDNSVPDKGLMDHLTDNGITGARIRKVANKMAPTKSYKVDSIKQCYNNMCDPDI